MTHLYGSALFTIPLNISDFSLFFNKLNQYWVKGIPPGAIKKLKSSDRTHVFEILNENSFFDHSLEAKFELKVNQF